MPRPTSLNEQRIQAMEKAASSGAKREHIAMAGGIHVGTYYNWMAKGKRGEGPYQEFYDRLQKAQSIGLQRNLDIIQIAADNGNWQAAAWLVERCWKYHKNTIETEDEAIVDTEDLSIRDLLTQLQKSNDELKDYMSPEIQD